MSWDELHGKLRGVVHELAPLLPTSEAREMLEYIDYDEPGLAFEMLCTQLYEYDSAVGREVVARLAEIGFAMQLEPRQARARDALSKSSSTATRCPALRSMGLFRIAGMEVGVLRQVRALYDEASVVVYQAYSREIAEPALRAGRFVEPFGTGRMTWVKPSFLWMAYRSGWGTKPGQTRVLRIRITRAGFEWALAHGVLSHYRAGFHESEAAWKQSLVGAPVRIQWDPEQTVTLTPQPRVRSIQIGLSGDAVRRYVNDWIVGLEDVTAEIQRVRDLAKVSVEAAEAALPVERPYPIGDEVAAHIGATPGAHSLH